MLSVYRAEILPQGLNRDFHEGHYRDAHYSIFFACKSGTQLGWWKSLLSELLLQQSPSLKVETHTNLDVGIWSHTFFLASHTNRKMPISWRKTPRSKSKQLVSMSSIKHNVATYPVSWPYKFVTVFSLHLNKKVNRKVTRYEACNPIHNHDHRPVHLVHNIWLATVDDDELD